jgi:hypothetical protein
MRAYVAPMKIMLAELKAEATKTQKISGLAAQ